MKVVSFLNECTNLTVFMIMAAMDPQESWGVQGLKFAQVAIRGISQALLGRGKCGGHTAACARWSLDQ